jgi:hypothetical protein
MCPPPVPGARRAALRSLTRKLAQEEKARVVQTLLFVAGINTLIQSFLGTRLPAVMGASYTFVAPTISIILAGRYNGIADPHEVRLLAFLSCPVPIPTEVHLFAAPVVAEIRAHHAGDARRAHCGLHPPNHHGLQWPLAHCRQVRLLLSPPWCVQVPVYLL